MEACSFRAGITTIQSVEAPPGFAAEIFGMARKFSRALMKKTETTMETVNATHRLGPGSKPLSTHDPPEPPGGGTSHRRGGNPGAFRPRPARAAGENSEGRPFH